MRASLVSPKFIWGNIAAIFVIHFFASFYFWYWKFPWLDILLHFWGGLATAAVFFYFSARYPDRAGFVGDFLPTLILALSFAAFVGVMWEFFEFSFDRIFSLQNTLWQSQFGLEDTITDLLMDLLGAGAFMAFYWRKSQ